MGIVAKHNDNGSTLRSYDCCILMIRSLKRTHTYISYIIWILTVKSRRQLFVADGRAVMGNPV